MTNQKPHGFGPLLPMPRKTKGRAGERLGKGGKGQQCAPATSKKNKNSPLVPPGANKKKRRRADRVKFRGGARLGPDPKKGCGGA